MVYPSLSVCEVLVTPTRAYPFAQHVKWAFEYEKSPSGGAEMALEGSRGQEDFGKAFERHSDMSERLFLGLERSRGILGG